MLRSELNNINSYITNDNAYQVKLDANETVFDLPEFIKDEINAEFKRLAYNRYPDGLEKKLADKVAAKLGVSSQNIIFGNGSSELLAKVCWVYGGKDKSVMFPSPSFSMYPIYARLAGSKAIPVELDKNFNLSKQQLLEKYAACKPSLIILCSPNNPTGNVMSQEDIKDILTTVDCPVIADEAYYEFYGKTALDIFSENKNLIIMRTFSKAYGLAALRIGYMIAHPEIIETVKKAIMPYHINALSLCAAKVVYDKVELLKTRVQAVIEARERLFIQIAKIAGIKVYPSKANFLLIKIPEHKSGLTDYLSQNGIAVRAFDNDRLNDCIRITIGSRADNEMVLQHINKFISNVR